jgi:hypothetical protein
MRTQHICFAVSTSRVLFILALWRKRHPLWEPPKILLYPTDATSFIVPPSCDIQIVILSCHCQPIYYAPKTLSPIFGLPTLAINWLCPNMLPPNFVVLTPTRHPWISPTLSSEIITTNNTINTQHFKTKTNIIKSTTTYIQPF